MAFNPLVTFSPASLHWHYGGRVTKRGWDFPSQNKFKTINDIVVLEGMTNHVDFDSNYDVKLQASRNIVVQWNEGRIEKVGTTLPRLIQNLSNVSQAYSDFNKLAQFELIECENDMIRKELMINGRDFKYMHGPFTAPFNLQVTIKRKWGDFMYLGVKSKERSVYITDEYCEMLPHKIFSIKKNCILKRAIPANRQCLVWSFGRTRGIRAARNATWHRVVKKFNNSKQPFFIPSLKCITKKNKVVNMNKNRADSFIAKCTLQKEQEKQKGEKLRLLKEAEENAKAKEIIDCFLEKRPSKSTNENLALVPYSFPINNEIMEVDAPRAENESNQILEDLSSRHMSREQLIVMLTAPDITGFVEEEEDETEDMQVSVDEIAFSDFLQQQNVDNLHDIFNNISLQ